MDVKQISNTRSIQIALSTLYGPEKRHLRTAFNWKLLTSVKSTLPRSPAPSGITVTRNKPRRGCPGTGKASAAEAFPYRAPEFCLALELGLLSGHLMASGDLGCFSHIGTQEWLPGQTDRLHLLVTSTPCPEDLSCSSPCYSLEHAPQRPLCLLLGGRFLCDCLLVTTRLN